MENRLLVISNACFSDSDSNGRSILRLLESLPKEQKAQFFTYGEPSFSACNNYYKISDKTALKSIIKRRIDGKVISLNNNKSIVSKKYKKTPLKMIIRELVWKFGGWKNKYLNAWINSFDPNCILLVGGDNCYLLDFAKKIAKEKKIPIILYSTEDYQFKDYNYLTKRKSIFYFFFRLKLKHTYKKVSKYVKAGIFNSDFLRELYSKNYSFDCYTIYQTSNINWVDKKDLPKAPRVSYLGNLGLKRYLSLIEIGECLNKIYPNIKLDVYGKCNEEEKKALLTSKYISYKGIVPYDEVIRIIHNSSLLIHTEYNNQFYLKDLKYAFSTKIGDCVSSGTPLLIYAPSQLAETKFLSDNKCAFVATNKSELYDQLKKSLTNNFEREKILYNAYQIKQKCFTNCGNFTNILEKVLNESSSD